MAEDRWDRRRQASEWLRRARERSGFATATDFAKALGWDQRLVSNYETGRSDVPDERAEDIARVLRMDIIDVRHGLGLWVPDDSKPSTNEPEKTPEEKLEEARRMLDEVRESMRARDEGETDKRRRSA